jgi:rare lipoprotein A
VTRCQAGHPGAAALFARRTSHTRPTRPEVTGTAASAGPLQVGPTGADDRTVRRRVGLTAPPALLAAALLAMPAGLPAAGSPGQPPATGRAVLAAAPLSIAPAAAPAPPPSTAPPGTAPPGTAPPGTAPPGTAPPATARDDLAAVQERLRAASAEAARLAAELETAAARDSALRTQLERLAEQQEQARRAVDARARQAYLAVSATGPGPLGEAVVVLASPDLRLLAEAELTRRGAVAATRAAAALADAVAAHSGAARELVAQAEQQRAALREQAALALTAQDEARALLAAAEAAVAAEEERLRAAQALQRATQAEAADRARAAELTAARAALATSRQRLDAASATTTRALTPAQTTRSRNAATREAPLVALAEAAGAGYPTGYGPSGSVLRGVASWYGPGFVGNPTASGAPYDPERMTCAHKTLPLGTLVRVSRDGRAVACLVNDRGPFVGDRILDLSRAGSRALGFDGVAPVSVEVLAPVG